MHNAIQRYTYTCTDIVIVEETHITTSVFDGVTRKVGFYWDTFDPQKRGRYGTTYPKLALCPLRLQMTLNFELLDSQSTVFSPLHCRTYGDMYLNREVPKPVHTTL